MQNTYQKNRRRREQRVTPTQRVWVTAYTVQQRYGGPEEGGWYYDDYTPEETVYCRREKALEVEQELMERHKPYLPGGFYGSVRGGFRIDVRIETRYQGSTTRRTPVWS
jgi:hypothetical protein